MIRSVDGNPCVLFVDDEEMTRKTFERIAASEFPVLLAGNVAEAIEVLKQRGDEIGVLLTDQRMPGGLGVELLEYARDQHPGIVRMLTTAYSELEDAIAAVNRGEIIRYIEKPWTNIDALLIDLRVAMRFHLLERSNEELMAEKFRPWRVARALSDCRYWRLWPQPNQILLLGLSLWKICCAHFLIYESTTNLKITMQ